MSFGKKYTSNKKAVDDAVKYAESKGVLLIHAAGNNSDDIDEIIHYPCKKMENGKVPSNFMNVLRAITEIINVKWGKLWNY